jgi:hypothetical protein
MTYAEPVKRTLGVTALLLAAACTIVVPAPDPPKPKTVVVTVDNSGPPKPPALEAHALFVMNLHQSSANLAPYYVTIADALIAGLTTRGINVVRWSVVPTYPGADGMRLLFGAQTPVVPPTLPPIPGLGGAGGGSTRMGSAGSGAGGASGGPPLPVPIPAPADTQSVPTFPPDLPAVPTLPNGTDIVSALQQLAASGKYDGVGTTNEAEGVIRTGNHLVEAHLPPDLGGLDGAAFFDRPRSLFLVIYLQPLSRKCDMGSSSCAVDGRSPADIFNESTADGSASWLHFATGGMPIDQVVHVAISTKEGETPAAFRARCGAINGFPPNLFDVMEPSSTLYFNPLLAALNAAHPGTGQGADLCDLLGEIGLTDETQRKSLSRLINSVASMAGPAPDTTSSTPPPGPDPLTP